MKTSNDLSQSATGKLWKQDRQTFESVSTIIADTYAEPMAELERLRLRVDNARKSMGRERFVRCYIAGTPYVMCIACGNIEPITGKEKKGVASKKIKCGPDCIFCDDNGPYNNEVAT